MKRISFGAAAFLMLLGGMLYLLGAAPTQPQWEYAEFRVTNNTGFGWSDRGESIYNNDADLWKHLNQTNAPARFTQWSVVDAAGQQGWELVARNRSNDQEPDVFTFKRAIH